MKDFFLKNQAIWLFALISAFAAYDSHFVPIAQTVGAIVAADLVKRSTNKQESKEDKQ